MFGDLPGKLSASANSMPTSLSILASKPPLYVTLLSLRGEDLKLPELQALSSSTGDEAGRFPLVMLDIEVRMAARCSWYNKSCIYILLI